MQRVMAVMGFISLATVSSAAAVEPFDASVAYVEAERDFESVRGELGLSGSAPLAGLERSAAERAWERRARRDFEAAYHGLGLSGSSPLAGLERYEITVRPQVAHVILANPSRRGR
jgi:hypothetical protein